MTQITLQTHFMITCRFNRSIIVNTVIYHFWHHADGVKNLPATEAWRMRVWGLTKCTFLSSILILAVATAGSVWVVGRSLTPYWVPAQAADSKTWIRQKLQDTVYMNDQGAVRQNNSLLCIFQNNNKTTL